MWLSTTYKSWDDPPNSQKTRGFVGGILAETPRQPTQVPIWNGHGFSCRFPGVWGIGESNVQKEPHQKNTSKERNRVQKIRFSYSNIPWKKSMVWKLDIPTLIGWFYGINKQCRQMCHECMDAVGMADRYNFCSTWLLIPVAHHLVGGIASRVDPDWPTSTVTDGFLRSTPQKSSIDTKNWN